MLNRREDLEMLTAEQIKAREFLVSLRGYDREEVHSFLDEVARLVGALQEHVESLEARQGSSSAPHVTAEPALAPPIAPAVDTTATFFEDLGKTTQRILEAAHEAGSEIQRKARNEADREIAEAHARATKLVVEGQRRREVIEGVVHTLEERRAALADDLRGVLQAVDQVLADFAPPGQLLVPDEFLAGTDPTAPDATWAPAVDLVFTGHEDDARETAPVEDNRVRGQLKSAQARDDDPDSDEEKPVAAHLAKASHGMRLG